jgi:DNA-binding transcriptional MerR regulator
MTGSVQIPEAPTFAEVRAVLEQCDARERALEKRAEAAERRVEELRADIVQLKRQVYNLRALRQRERK